MSQRIVVESCLYEIIITGTKGCVAEMPGDALTVI